MTSRHDTNALWVAVLEHAIWVVALASLFLASDFFPDELPYSAYPTLFLMVALLTPAEMVWSCVIASSCHDSGHLTPMHFVALFGLVVLWLTVPMVLAAAFDERMRWCAGQDRSQSGIGRTSLVFFMGTGLSMAISIVGGANSNFWRGDLTLEDSLGLNLFILPIALLPIGAMALRRGIVVLWRAAILPRRLGR
jgi:hypothetical protein